MCELFLEYYSSFIIVFSENFGLLISPLKTPYLITFLRKCSSVARVGQTGRWPRVFQEFKNVATVIYRLPIKIAVKFILMQYQIYTVPCTVIQFWLYLHRNSFKCIVNEAQTKNQATSNKKNVADFNFFFKSCHVSKFWLLRH